MFKGLDGIICRKSRDTFKSAKRKGDEKNWALRELSDLSSQMGSSVSRVRKSDVDEARRQAAKLTNDRDDYNNHPRREDITREIRVQEDKLKSIATTIEQDTKIRDQLRLRSKEQNEIDMLEGQVSQGENPSRTARTWMSISSFDLLTIPSNVWNVS